MHSVGLRSTTTAAIASSVRVSGTLGLRGTSTTQLDQWDVRHRWRGAQDIDGFSNNWSGADDEIAPLPFSAGIVFSPDPITADVVLPDPLLVTPAIFEPGPIVTDLVLPTPTLVVAEVLIPLPIVTDVVLPPVSFVSPEILTPEPIIVDIVLPPVSFDTGDAVFLVSPVAARLTMATPRLIVGQLGQTLADLNLAAPNIVTQETYLVTISGAETGLADIRVPAISIEAVKRKYEQQVPIFGYSLTGQLPAQRESGAYLSSDSGVAWQWQSLPELDTETLITASAVATKGGTTYAYMAGLQGDFLRIAAVSGVRLEGAFLGPSVDATRARSGQAIAVAPGASQVILYAAGISAGIWRSTDNGHTFGLSNGGQGVSLGGAAVAFHPTVTGLCYCAGFASGTEGAPVYKSTNSGASWTLVNTLDLTQGRVYTIGLSTETSTVYLRTQGGVLKSTDQGANFSPIQSGLPATVGDTSALAVSLSDPTVLYVSAKAPDSPASLHTWLYKSTNGGISWTPSLTFPQSVTSGIAIRSVAIHPTDPLEAMVATSGPLDLTGVYITSDGGSTWLRKTESDGIVDPSYLSAVAYDANTAVAVGRRRVPSVAAPEFTRIGTRFLRGEIHEATITMPFSAEILAAIDARVNRTGPTPVFPRISISRAQRYRSGAEEHERLCEIRLERIDVRQGATDRQFSLFGRLTHEQVSRDTEDTKVLPREAIATIEETATDYSVALPGCQTEWQCYDTVSLDSRDFRISAVRYNLTMDRRVTILGVATVTTTQLNPDAESSVQHPQVIIGQSPGARVLSIVPRQIVLPPRGN